MCYASFPEGKRESEMIDGQYSESVANEKCGAELARHGYFVDVGPPIRMYYMEDSRNWWQRYMPRILGGKPSPSSPEIISLTIPEVIAVRKRWATLKGFIATEENSPNPVDPTPTGH
jgi:hypothetical protein